MFIANVSLMRLAFFNWRDIKHPRAGGAEVYNHQILKRLAAMGHRVTLFTASFPGCARSELIEGIEHIRYGGRFTIYPLAYACYKKHVEGRYDVVVECINGMPFFLPFFARERVVPLIYQLTRENWHSGLVFPLAFAGYHLEDSFLGIYREKPVLTISESTKSDLQALGFREIAVVNAAAEVSPPSGTKKQKQKTLICLGRLTKSKRVDHALSAFKIIKNSIPGARLWIVGTGPEEKRLKALACGSGISRDVCFFGRVSEKKKAELLSKAHLMLFPAVREGWGIVVLEANACGTPVMGYAVPGLIDSIKENVNGQLVSPGNFTTLAEKAIKLLQNPPQLKRLSVNSIKYSKKFTWEKAADGLISFLEGVSL